MTPQLSLGRTILYYTFKTFIYILIFVGFTLLFQYTLQHALVSEVNITLFEAYYKSYLSTFGILGFALAGIGFVIFVVLFTLFFARVKHPGYRLSRRTLFVKGTVNFIILSMFLFVTFHLAIGTAFFDSLLALNEDQKQITADFSSKWAETDSTKVNEFIAAQNEKQCINLSFSEEDAIEDIYIPYVQKKHGYGGFYTKQYLPKVTVYLPIYLPSEEKNVFMLNNKVYILHADKESLLKISNTLANNLISCTLPLVNIQKKSPPKLSVLNETEYAEYINAHLGEILKKENDAINEANKMIRDIQNYLNQLKNYYARYKTSNVAAQIKETEKILKGWQDYKTELESDKATIAKRLSEPQATVGHYFSPDSIAVLLDQSDAKHPSLYVSTLIHENLHYLSDVGDKTLDTFFEEGLTQSLTRDIMSKKLGEPISTSYPIPVYIIREMTKKIPREKFIEIYFSKDQARLEKLLNEAYGTDFYKTYKADLQLIHNKKDSAAIDKANEILLAIDGEPLTEEILQGSSAWGYW